MFDLHVSFFFIYIFFGLCSLFVHELCLSLHATSLTDCSEISFAWKRSRKSWGKSRTGGKVSILREREDWVVWGVTCRIGEMWFRNCVDLSGLLVWWSRMDLQRYWQQSNVMNQFREFVDNLMVLTSLVSWNLCANWLSQKGDIRSENLANIFWGSFWTPSSG